MKNLSTENKELKQDILKICDRFFLQFTEVIYEDFMKNKSKITVENMKKYLEEKFEYYKEEIALFTNEEYQNIIDRKESELKKKS